ncbi:MAG: PEP-CTERM sorting domain-containing protein [Opitutales bacterium]|nr:PEP-CTERM sorting domain-containing protein [Opitutales bacterium]
MKKLLVLFLTLSAGLLSARTLPNGENITTHVVETEKMLVDAGSLTISGEGALLEFNINSAPQYSLAMKGSSELLITNGGSLDMNSPSSSAGGIQLNTSSVMTIDSTAGEVYTDKVALASAKAVLNINKENAMVSCSSGVPYVYLTLPSNATVNLNASHAFRLDVRNGITPTIKFANGAVLSVMSWEYNGTSASLKLVDFVDNSIFFSTGDNDDYIYSYEENVLTIKNGSSTKTISILNESGQAFEGLALHATEGGYFLAAAVPEPAEWAMIFGALALGLAIYRRRK